MSHAHFLSLLCSAFLFLFFSFFLYFTHLYVCIEDGDGVRFDVGESERSGMAEQSEEEVPL